MDAARCLPSARGFRSCRWSRFCAQKDLSSDPQQRRPMELIDHFLACLEHFKPLWDFLTAIGTVGAVVVALLLALRKPKVRLSPGARMQGTTIVLSATNKGSEPATVLGWEWR